MTALRYALGWTLAVAGILWTLFVIIALAEVLAEGSGIDVWATVQLFSAGLLGVLAGLLLLDDRAR